MGIFKNIEQGTQATNTGGGVFSRIAEQNTGTGNSIQQVTGQNPIKNNNWFDYNKDDSFTMSTAKTVGNVLPSLWGLGKGIVSAVAHPIDTVTNIGKLVAGTAGQGAKYALDHTDMGNSLKEELNKIRMANGVESLPRDAQGHLITQNTEEMDQAGAVGQYFKDRYGGTQNIAKTLVEDPAGIALDVSTLFSGGASLAGKGAKLAEVADMAKTASTLGKTANVLEKAGEVSNPISLTGKLANKTVVPYTVKKGKDVAHFISTPASELKAEAMVKGLESLTDSLKGVKNKYNKTSYTQVLEDGTKVKINPISTFGEKEYVPDVVNGKINVDKIKTKIASEIDDLDTQIETKLNGVETPIKIDDFKNKIINQIKNNEVLKDSGKVQTTLNKLESVVNDWKGSYGDEMPMSRINNIRKVANKDFNPDTVDLSRMIGNAGREVVYNATPDMAVKKLLAEQRKYINADEFASSIANHAVKGGRAGNYAWSIGGTMAGSALPLPLGLGPVLGGMAGRGISEVIQRRQFKSLPADIKGGLEKVLGNRKKVVMTPVDDVTEVAKPLEIPPAKAPEGNYQKSPNNQPTNMSANTTANMNDIIPQEISKIAEPEYRYHATSFKNYNKMVNDGYLKPANGMYGDGVYFAPNINGTKGWSGKEKEAVIIRMDKKTIPAYDEFPDQGWSDTKVPLQGAEVSIDGGKTWIKIGGDSGGGLSKVLGSQK